MQMTNIIMKKMSNLRNRDKTCQETRDKKMSHLIHKSEFWWGYDKKRHVHTLLGGAANCYTISGKKCANKVWMTFKMFLSYSSVILLLGNSA